MARSTPLPGGFDSGAFSVSAARKAGISRGRLRGRDLHAPFYGVRQTGEPQSVRELAAAFSPRMHCRHVFAGRTAARLWGLPVREQWQATESLVIGVPRGRARTRARGTVVRELDGKRMAATDLDGLRLLDPASTVMSMARDAPHGALVELIDALITDAEHYPGLHLVPPHTTTEQLEAFARRCAGMHGALAFQRALADARVGAESPRETRCRLAIVAAGLPEPVVQHEVWHGGALVAVIDLAYPALRIAIEYEGEHHLTDPKQWARDIARQERLESLGWIVIRATKRDLSSGAAPLIARVRSAVARRTA